MTIREDREAETAIQNLKRLIETLPMIEAQRNIIIHAIKVIRERM